MIGDEMRAARARVKLSREALAAKSGISAKTIQRLENGDRPADMVQMFRLCEVFDLDIVELLARAIARATHRGNTGHLGPRVGVSLERVHR
jgi:transcriptional regulator with XRE-family HTH domain